jgi:alkylation response protein AidB-like acyl-CoA dehydrogenase
MVQAKPDAIPGGSIRCYRTASLAIAGKDLGTLASVATLFWSTTHQRLVDLGYQWSVETGFDIDYWFLLWLETRAELCRAGSSQIQRDIVSERLLGLPR